MSRYITDYCARVDEAMRAYKDAPAGPGDARRDQALAVEKARNELAVYVDALLKRAYEVEGVGLGIGDELGYYAAWKIRRWP